MGYRYAVIGSGRQGAAAAYDIARHGDADEVLLLDRDPEVARHAARRIDRLLGKRVSEAIEADAADSDGLAARLEGVTALLSGVHYPLNLGLAELAVRIGASFCDLGGNTAVVRRQLELDPKARAAGVSVVPDCGMGPGLNVSLAVYVTELLDRTREVYIWDGGLPQDPEPPWHYASTFNIRGLTNEYAGHAYFLRNGRVVEVPCFEGHEELTFRPPVGRLEAFVTSGGLSTSPWTFEGKLERLENKTLRYPGHWAQFRAFAELGLLSEEPVEVAGARVVPREVLHALLEPKITRPNVRDVCVMRVKGAGEKDGEPAEAVVELIDFYDESTGFSAMERLTGWHASIVTILAAQGRVPRGAVPVELAVPGHVIVEEARRRGFVIEESVRSVR